MTADYAPTVWVDGVTDLSPANLNKIETQLDAVTDTALAAIGKPSTPSTNDALIWNGSTWVNQKILNANIAAGAAIDASKLAGYPADVTKYFRGDGSWPTLAAYADYTPAWTATAGTAPAIGNAVVVGRYMQIGKFVHCYGVVTFGGSSTFGSAGAFRFSLPVTASANAVSSQGGPGGFLYDNSANALMFAQVALPTSGVLGFVYGATYGGTQTSAGISTPWTWATSDIIAWNLAYEAA